MKFRNFIEPKKIAKISLKNIFEKIVHRNISAIEIKCVSHGCR